MLYLCIIQTLHCDFPYLPPPPPSMKKYTWSRCKLLKWWGVRLFWDSLVVQKGHSQKRHDKLAYILNVLLTACFLLIYNGFALYK